MMLRWTRLAAAAAGLAVGAGCLALAFRGTDPRAVLALLHAGRWGAPAGLVLAGTVGFVLLKSARWRLLLGSPPELGVLRLAQPVLAGLALNALVPHAGEFVRALALQRGSGRAASAVLSSIVAERLFDLLGVLILGVFALAGLPVPHALVAAVRLLALVAAVLAAGVVLALAAPRTVHALAATLGGALPGRARAWLLRQVGAALAGLEPVRSLAISAKVFGCSLLQWLAVALCVYGSAGVAGFSPSLAATCLVVVGIVVAFLLPNAPGYTGSVQVAFRYALQPLGVAEEAALAASLVYQLLMVLPTIVVGLALLKRCLTGSAQRVLNSSGVS